MAKNVSFSIFGENTSKIARRQKGEKKLSSSQNSSKIQNPSKTQGETKPKDQGKTREFDVSLLLTSTYTFIQHSYRVYYFLLRAEKIAKKQARFSPKI